MPNIYEKIALRGVKALDESELLTLLLEDEALVKALLE